jgi:hypothetical protein
VRLIHDIEEGQAESGPESLAKLSQGVDEKHGRAGGSVA